MTDAQVQAALSVREVLALTLFGEARGEPLEGKVFVGCVIRNRVRTVGRWADSYPGVCLAPSQFSCWSPAGGSSNYAAVMTLARAFVGDFHDRPTITPLLRELIYLAEGLVGEQLQDNAQKANHYCTRALWQSARPPSWTIGQTPVAEVGAHVGFFL